MQPKTFHLNYCSLWIKAVLGLITSVRMPGLHTTRVVLVYVYVKKWKRRNLNMHPNCSAVITAWVRMYQVTATVLACDSRNPINPLIIELQTKVVLRQCSLGTSKQDRLCALCPACSARFTSCLDHFQFAFTSQELSSILIHLVGFTLGLYEWHIAERSKCRQ